MTDLDDQIRTAMSGVPADDDAAGALHAVIVDSFRGRARWLAFFAWIKISAGMACTAVAAVAFFHVESTRALVAWATLFGVGALATMLWWTWYWMLVHRNAEAREIKRLEVAVVTLASRLEHPDARAAR